MRPLRVAIDARLMAGTPGGLEQVIIGLASALSQLDDGDEEYLFLCFPDSDSWIAPYLRGRCRVLHAKSASTHVSWLQQIRNAPGIKSLVENLSPLAGPATVPVRRSDGVLESSGADVMHFALQQAFLTSVPSIYHPHDLQHRHFPQYFTRRTYMVRDVIYRAYCKQAAVVAVTSSWTKADLVEQYGLSPDKIVVIPWAPVNDFYPVPAPSELQHARDKFDLPASFILYPAQTFAHKNHLGLLEALRILKQRDGLIVPLVACGRKNSFYPTVERRVVNLGLQDQVRFTGFVSSMELQCLYQLSQSVVIPTKFEAASFPVWEAFLAGRAVACSNVTSLPRQAGDAALIFDPNDIAAIADAIGQLWTTPALRADLVERGKRNIGQFSWDRTVRHFRAFYRQLARRPLTDEDHALMAAHPLL